MTTRSRSHTGFSAYAIARTTGSEIRRSVMKLRVRWPGPQARSPVEHYRRAGPGRPRRLVRTRRPVLVRPAPGWADVHGRRRVVLRPASTGEDAGLVRDMLSPSVPRWPWVDVAGERWRRAPSRLRPASSRRRAAAGSYDDGQAPLEAQSACGVRCCRAVHGFLSLSTVGLGDSRSRGVSKP